MKAFLVEDGMLCRRYNDEYPISITGNLQFEHCYSLNNSVVVYVYNQKIYVFPYNKNGVDELIENGFKQIDMYVPFSNHDRPVDRLDEYKEIFMRR